MKYEVDQAVEILRRTPSTLTALLSGLPDVWTRSTEGEGTWSAQDIVGHLLHGEEADWMVRARIILEHGEREPFEKFNRVAMRDKYHDYSLERLLDAFAQARNENLTALCGLKITP